jgi:hypothetical protein
LKGIGQFRDFALPTVSGAKIPVTVAIAAARAMVFDMAGIITIPTGIDSIVITALSEKLPTHQKLADAVTAAWQRLPDHVTKPLLAKWEGEMSKAGQGPGNSPPIPFISMKTPLDKATQFGGSTEAVVFMFDTIACEKISSGQLETLVAHELIHGYRNATGQLDPDDKQEELEVRRLTKELGFDQDDLTKALKNLHNK